MIHVIPRVKPSNPVNTDDCFGLTFDESVCVQPLAISLLRNVLQNHLSSTSVDGHVRFAPCAEWVFASRM